ncbi:hypothetical protein ACFL4V_00330 [Candidatus Latescibacterota bacterium]
MLKEISVCNIYSYIGLLGFVNPHNFDMGNIGIIDDEGQVPPRVLKRVLSDGWFCEDEIMREYYGGVLASSRSTINRDDRGKTYLELLSNLSTYQTRTYYIVYTILKHIFSGCELNPGIKDDLENMR